MLEQLTDRLARIAKQMRGQARLTEANTQDMLREVRLALLEADVALPVVRDFIARVRERPVENKFIGISLDGPATDFATLRQVSSFSWLGPGIAGRESARRCALPSCTWP